MNYEAHIIDGQSLFWNFNIIPSTLIHEINAFTLYIEHELCIAAWKQLQYGKKSVKLFVKVITPTVSCYYKELAFENDERSEKIEQKIRDEARNLCFEIQKELAIDAICSHKFRNLKYTEE